MPVIPLSTGFIDRVEAARGSVSLVGAFMGCEFVSGTTGKVVFSNNWPGSGADGNHPVKALVADDQPIILIASDASLTVKQLQGLLYLLMPTFQVVKATILLVFLHSISG